MVARLALLAALALPLSAQAALYHSDTPPYDPVRESQRSKESAASARKTFKSLAQRAIASAAGNASAVEGDSSEGTATVTAKATPTPLRANNADSGDSILTNQKYSYTALPYQVAPYQIGRGPQSGYNICNSTTSGPNSQCQTLVLNALDDFCLWGSAVPDSTIGEIEAAVISYCTPNHSHGSRLMPDGTITGAQFITTSAYIQITGFLDQTKLGLQANDTGGELDPHGADLMGNPVGGLVYSTNLPGQATNVTLEQVYNWNQFIGSGAFCIKLCNNAVTSPNYCQNKYDLMGCQYNMPSANVDGEFTSCEGDLQDEVGVYVENGQTMVYSQPESFAQGVTVPYTPRVPASSNCVTYASTQLFGGTPTTSSAASAATANATGSATSGASGLTNAAAVAGQTSNGRASASASATASTSGGVFATSAGSNSAVVTLVLGLGALLAGALVVV